MIFPRARALLFRLVLSGTLYLSASAVLENVAGAKAVAASGQEIATAARLGVHDGRTRFVVELTSKVPYKISFLTAPNRLVLELPELAWHVQGRGGSGGLVSAYRFAVTAPGKSQIVLDLTGPVKIKTIEFMAPRDGHDWRLVLDMAATSKAEFQRLAADHEGSGSKEPGLKEKPVAEAKPAPEPGIALVVTPPKTDLPELGAVELPKITAPKVEFAEALLSPPPAAAVSALASPIVPKPPVAAPPGPLAALPAPVLPTPPQVDKTGSGKKVVVIDPGHGGIDPGAQSSDGTKEKDVVFKVAQELAKSLEKTGRYRAVLTREGDVFLKLSERVDLARRVKADLFISLHADVLSDSPDVSGTAVYTLSEKASDKEAEALAGKENRADIIAGVDLSHESDDVTFILIDLAQRETMSRSAQFARAAEDALLPFTPMVKNTTRQAGFRVLKAPDVPSVLIELGYLSNRTDFARITSERWTGQFADALVAAADRQFQLNDTRRVERTERASIQ